MIGLFVDTAAKNGVALVVKGEHVLASLEFVSSEGVFKPIEKILTTSGVDKKDLEFIAAGKGPGSFTGIRVSQMALRSIAFGLSLPFYGISSLSLYKSQVPVALDARSGGIWVQVEGEEPERVLPESIESFLNQHASLSSPDPEPLIRRLGETKVISTLFDPEKIAYLLSVEVQNDDNQNPEILYL